MKTIEKEAIVSADGSFLVSNVPFGPGEEIVVSIRKKEIKRKAITAAEILASDFVGSWEGRDDLPDSPEYARILREGIEKRGW